MVWGFDGVIICSVPVPAFYIPNVIAFADISSDAIYSIFRRGTALFGFIGSGCSQFALCGSWLSLSACTTRLSCTTIFGEDRALCLWRSCCMVGRDSVVAATFFNDE